VWEGRERGCGRVRREGVGGRVCGRVWEGGCGRVRREGKERGCGGGCVGGCGREGVGG
jgi:hypothetical protein